MEVENENVNDEVQVQDAEIAAPTDAEVSDAEAPEYVPSYTYKVLDEERQFDERLKAAIKSKEDEDYIRDLYTKADGLENYKRKYGEVEGKVSKLSQANQKLVEGLKKIQKFRDEGDLESLFEALGIDEDAHLQHSLTVAQRRQLPEDQRNAHLEARRYKSEAERNADRLAELERRDQERFVESQINELKILTSAPEVQSLSSMLASKGVNLNEEILKHGHFMYQQNGYEPSVKEAVDSVVKKYSAFVQTQSPQAQQLAVIEKKSTTPAIKGTSGVNRAEKKVSLADLKKMADNI